MTDSRKPTPTDQEQQGQPAPETQPDPQRSDHTPQGRTDEDAEEKGSNEPGDA